MPQLIGFSSVRDARDAVFLANEYRRNVRFRKYIHNKPELLPDDGGSGGGGILCRAYTQLPARADDDTLGDPTTVVICTVSDLGVVNEEIQGVDVWSWVQSPSADPADDPKGYIYIWVEKGMDGQWYWTGEDCPVIDPGEPVEELPSGGQAPDNANLILVT